MNRRELIIKSKTHGVHTILYDDVDADKIEPYSWSIVKGHGNYSIHTVQRYRRIRRFIAWDTTKLPKKLQECEIEKRLNCTVNSLIPTFPKRIIYEQE